MVVKFSISLIMSALTSDTEYRVVLFDFFNINPNHCVEKIIFTYDMNRDVVGCDSFQ